MDRSLAEQHRRERSVSPLRSALQAVAVAVAVWRAFLVKRFLRVCPIGTSALELRA